MKFNAGKERINRYLLILICMVFVSGLLLGCAQKPPQKADKLTQREQLNLQLSIRYLQQGDFESAADKLYKVLETRPNLVVANSLLGLIYNELGDMDRAGRHFKQALRSADKNQREFADVNNNYGIYLCRQGDYEAAQKAFRQAYDHRAYQAPESAYENAALCALENKKADQAETFFRKALGLKQSLPRSLLGMTKLQLELGKPFIARAYIQRYEQSRSVPTAESLWLGYAIEKQLNSDKQAEKYETELLSKFPDSEYAAKLKQGSH